MDNGAVGVGYLNSSVRGERYNLNVLRRWSDKRFTLNFLYQSIDMIISTAMCQHSDTAQCNVIWK
jgi:hypothetical protein